MIFNNIYFNKKQNRGRTLLKCLTSICPIYLCLILCFILGSNVATAQCVDAGNYWNKSWFSCEETLTPNPDRTNPYHWLEYQFHQAQSIDSIRIWNANRTGESNMGVQEMRIDYSIDGTNWVENAMTVMLPQANEQANYQGYQFATIFENIFVQKILFVVETTHGNTTCASLAEVQLKINNDACYGVIDECGVCNGQGAMTWYADMDNDGLGDPNDAVQACNQPNQYVENSDDECDNDMLGWNDVSVIFRDNGCLNCHGDLSLGGLNLETYGSAAQGGNKCGTNILTGTTLTDIIMIEGYAGCGSPISSPSMNQRTGGQIDANELALLQNWIDSGAPENCNCFVGATDTDNDGTCDAIDDCPGFDNQLIGTPCDDGFVCTENDVWTSACDCAGQLSLDSDKDGVCDIEDLAPNNPCTADGTIDGIEPADWLAAPTNDCDNDGFTNFQDDIDDFTPCINNKGWINSAACNCPNENNVAGGRFIGHRTVGGTVLYTDGMPDGLMNNYIGWRDSILLDFPYMSAGEDICVTLGFEDALGAVTLSLNNNSYTVENPTGLGNYTPQELCLKTYSEGQQTLVVEYHRGFVGVDGSTYSYCPCSTSDPKFGTPDCDCPYDSVSGNGVYSSDTGVANAQSADGAPDGASATVSGNDVLSLNFPNINASGEICITLSFDAWNGIAGFDLNGELHYLNNALIGNNTPREFCFPNKSGHPNLIIRDLGNGVINVDGSRYSYCNDCPQAPVSANLHALLEGNYDSTSQEMTTDLQVRGLLPGQTPASNLATPTPAGQPYSIAPWNYTGIEGAGWTDGDYTGDETDWVLVSFRTGTAKNTEVARTAALLNRDGSIRFPDRCALPPYSDGTPLYVVIEHRNHIGIMTPQPVKIGGNALTYDFRRSDSYKDVTSFGQKQTSAGKWLMFAGDADQSDFPSFDIKGTDKTIWFENNGIFDYYLSPDFNLDGDINGQDKSLWFDNNGISSRVPK